MIPHELLTLGVSTLAGGGMKLMGMWVKLKAQQNAALLQMAGQKHSQTVELSNTGTPQYQWTRRTIALMVTFAVMVLPKLAVLVSPELAVTYGWTSSPSGLWSWFSGTDQLVWHSVQGIVITPLDTNFAMAICGLYFGASIVGRN